MHKIFLKKKSGGTRTIYVPSYKEARRLRRLLPELQRIAEDLDPHGVAHGFRYGRSPVSMAEVHVGYQFTLSMDLEDFFDSITEDHLRHALDEKTLKMCLVDGAPRQGLPTSPVLANIAAAKMDEEIVAWIKRQEVRAVYTRYADDLVVSYDDPAFTQPLRENLEEIIVKAGFRINHKKTRLQCAKAGRRIICGVAVDDSGVYAPRKTRRRLRAALHNLEQQSAPTWKDKLRAQGLAAWVEMKKPLGGEPREARRTRREAQKALDIFANFLN